VPPCGSYFWWASWATWLPFYMLDPRFIAIVFVVSACALTNDLIQKDHGYLCPKAKLYLLTGYMPKLRRL
jgi:hypothetical protein